VGDEEKSNHDGECCSDNAIFTMSRTTDVLAKSFGWHYVNDASKDADKIVHGWAEEGALFCITHCSPPISWGPSMTNKCQC